MRLLPQSIAGRTTMVLIGGVCLILAVGAAVSSLLLFDGAGSPRPARLIERVVTLTAIVNGVPAAVRPDAVAAIDDPLLNVSWTPDSAHEAVVARDWFSLRLEKRLRRILRRLGVRSVVVGHQPDPSRAGDGWAIARTGPLLVWVKLADGTWLKLVAAREWHNPYRLVGLALMIVIVGGGIAVLAVWVARRVTAPLGRFATAARRLGTDVDAPPMSDEGPSEIKEAAEAFNLMQRRLRRFIGDRMHMLAAVSHDLRTPITRLRLRAEFVDDEDERAKMLKDLDEMEGMIASAIAFAREETVSEPRVHLDLAQLIAEIRSELADAGHSVALEGPERLAYDGRPTALKRAFRNLIENAVTYGGRAEVRLDPGGEHVVVTIDDEGPGIPEHEREQVFTPFYRLEGSRSRTTGGTGLGLSVARTVIRGHGGDITLTNRPEGGLRQKVVLPRPA